MIIDCHNHVGVDLRFYLRSDFPYAQSLVGLIGQGRRLGVERWIVFPMVSNLTFDLAKLRAGECHFGGGLESVPYAFENERLLQEVYDYFPEQGQSILPFVMLDPMHDPAGQIGALKRLRHRYRFYGFKIQSTLIQADIRCLAQQGRGFLELAAEWDIPFLIHSSVAPADSWAQARDILDLAEANPPVRFCLAHSCRFDRECLDRLNALPNAWFDCSAHIIHCLCATRDLPAVAPRERRFDSDYSSPAQVLGDLASAYPGKLLWGSDSPFYSYISHQEGYSLASSYEAETAVLHAQSAPSISTIAGENTRRFLQLHDESILAGK